MLRRDRHVRRPLQPGDGGPGAGDRRRRTSGSCGGLIEQHVALHRQRAGGAILEDWEACLPLFVKVFPMEYRRVLGQMSREDEADRARGGASMGKAAAGIPGVSAARTRATGRWRSGCADFKAVELPPDRRGDPRAGGALHGLRHAVLPRLRLPAGQRHPGVQRPRLPRPLGGGAGPAAGRRTASRSSPAGSARRSARASCVLGITSEPVTIRQIELAIIEKGFERGLHAAAPARGRRAGARGGGRLRPGRAGGGRRAEPGRVQRDRLRRDAPSRAASCATAFPTSSWRSGSSTGASDLMEQRRRRSSRPAWTIGRDVSYRYLRDRFDAIVLAGGAREPRDLAVPGRDLAGHPFRDGLPGAAEPGCSPASRSSADSAQRPQGKRVVVIGGGDTGADCVGTALRQGGSAPRSTAAASPASTASVPPGVSPVTGSSGAAQPQPTCEPASSRTKILAARSTLS